MDFSHWFLLVWTVLILYVLGEIWFAQIVVYPLFAKVGEAEYEKVIRELILYNWPRTISTSPALPC
jgi:hypothetical protein